MKLAITFLCLAGVAFSAPIGHTELSDMFRQFKTDFNKVYEHATEEAMRFGIFTKTVDMIQDFNEHAAASQGFTMGINQFSDWTREEYSSFLTYNASAKKANNVVVLDETNLTDSVDWVAKGAVTPVKNQKTCGSCWAFSTTGSIEGAVQINGGGLISLSEQELVDCAGTYGNQGCNGGLMDDAFKFVQAKGLEKESDYSYTAATGTCNTQKEDEHDGIAPGKIKSFNDVTANSCSQLKAAVTKQPVSVAIQANQPAFQNYKQGILSSGCGTQLDHGVLVVGYGSDNGKDYWKVKNSWGATWGDEGYLKIAMTGCDSGRRLLGGGGGGSKKGVCGILSTPSYPVV